MIDRRRPRACRLLHARLAHRKSAALAADDRFGSEAASNERIAADEEIGLDRFVIISGCSGGGKSTLLAELHRRGHATVEEPGGRIVAAELEAGAAALPWVDGVAFARQAIELSLADRAEAEERPSWVFFDRGLIDAAAALEHLTGEPAVEALGGANRYHRGVFLAPPWPEIYAMDHERRHGLAAAIAEYHRLCKVYPSLGYEVCLLPKVGVAERTDLVLATLAA